MFTFLSDAIVISVSAKSIKPVTNYYSASDNFVATMSFSDGSLATLTYTAMGSTDYPKEVMEIFVDGKVIALEDYQLLKVSGTALKPFSTRTQQKGQIEELGQFANAVQLTGEWPIPLWQQEQATEIALSVENCLVFNREGVDFEFK